MKHILIAAALLATPAAGQTAQEVNEVLSLVERRADCVARTLLWNTGHQDQLRIAYGDRAEAVVKACGITVQAIDGSLARFLEQHPEALTPPGRDQSIAPHLAVR